MSIKIEVSVDLLRKAFIAAISNEYQADDYEAFGGWMFDRYVANNGNLAEDITNQFEHAGYDLGVAIFQTIDKLEDHKTLRHAWFRHCHRDGLLTLQQAEWLIQHGHELDVCNYNADQEIDMFTSVTLEDFNEEFGESLTEWLRDMQAWAK
jgi:hypothetical protein